ncbi:hypothetical protein D3C78_419290 [compost metagenome]
MCKGEYFLFRECINSFRTSDGKVLTVTNRLVSCVIITGLQLAGSELHASHFLRIYRA